MKIAIHSSEGSSSARWIDYCKKNKIPFKVVNAYDTDIVAQVKKDCDVFMWHHSHCKHKDKLFAKQLLFSLQQAGIKTFPDFNMGWAFDDKIGEKYMLEAVDAPLVPSYVFYDKSDALAWVDRACFPKVFKLRAGASSSNVSLAKTPREARRLVRKAFGRGFSQFNRKNFVKNRFVQYRCGKESLFNAIKGLTYFFRTTEFARLQGRDKGYIYFQDFIPNNKFDTRVIVIGNKAFGLKRMCRPNDFRASGTPLTKYEKKEVDERFVIKSFEISEKLNNRCMALDWVIDEKNNPLLVEIGYGFCINYYNQCPGYWDKQMNWHEGHFIPQNWMIEDIIENFDKKNNCK